MEAQMEVTWKCENHSSYVGDPAENPHTVVEVEGIDLEGVGVFRKIVQGTGCPCGGVIEEHWQGEAEA